MPVTVTDLEEITVEGDCPPVRPETKEQCKNGGHATFKDEDGDPLFKNQGDCVSYVATRGKNEPNGG